MRLTHKRWVAVMIVLGCVAVGWSQTTAELSPDNPVTLKVKAAADPLLDGRVKLLEKQVAELQLAVKSIDATPVSRATVEQTTIGAIRKQ